MLFIVVFLYLARARRRFRGLDLSTCTLSSLPLWRGGIQTLRSFGIRMHPRCTKSLASLNRVSRPFFVSRHPPAFTLKGLFLVTLHFFPIVASGRFARHPEYLTSSLNILCPAHADVIFPFLCSLITTPPPSRRPIKTHLQQFDEKLIEWAIEQELERGGQVYYIVPRIHGKCPELVLSLFSF